MKTSNINGFQRLTVTDEQRVKATPKRDVVRSSRAGGAKAPLSYGFRRFFVKKVTRTFETLENGNGLSIVFCSAGLERFVPNLLMKTGILLICHFMSLDVISCFPATWRSKVL